MDPKTKIRRILSFDGAGIYGLTSALWIEQLIAANPTFMRSPKVDLFAGTSSGAVNALLLAKEPDSCKGAPSLASFWRAAEPWSNKRNPMDRILSLYGLSAWYGTEDYLSFLESTFGTMTLRQLPHKVLVTAYDLTGASTKAEAEATRPPPATSHHPMLAWLHAMGTGNNGQCAEHSEPIVITNFLDDHFLDWRVADVAYMATAMPALRAIRGGIGDGGIYDANPSSLALSAAVAHEVQICSDTNRTIATVNVLSELAMLSMGDGSKQPSYWLTNFNFGIWPWTLLPVHPLQAPFPPSGYSLQAPAQMSDLVVHNLIGDEQYFRLNPGILEFPTAGTVYAARLDLARRAFIQMVEAAAVSPTSSAAVKAASAFVSSEAWSSSTWLAARHARPDQAASTSSDAPKGA